MTKRSVPRTLQGRVVKISGTQSISVETVRVVVHPLYEKRVRRRSKIMVHDEHQRAEVGHWVTIQECAPISKRKRWTLVNVKATMSANGKTGDL